MIVSDLWLLVGMLLMFVAGIMFALGPLTAIQVRLARRRNRRLVAKLTPPKQVPPPTMPRAWVEYWARLNEPTVTRRRGRN